MWIVRQNVWYGCGRPVHPVVAGMGRPVHLVVVSVGGPVHPVVAGVGGPVHPAGGDGRRLCAADGRGRTEDDATGGAQVGHRWCTSEAQVGTGGAQVGCSWRHILRFSLYNVRLLTLVPIVLLEDNFCEK